MLTCQQADQSKDRCSASDIAQHLPARPLGREQTSIPLQRLRHFGFRSGVGEGGQLCCHHGLKAKKLKFLRVRRIGRQTTSKLRGIHLGEIVLPVPDE